MTEIDTILWLLIQGFALFSVGSSLRIWKHISKVANPFSIKELSFDGLIGLSYIMACYKSFYVLYLLFDFSTLADPVGWGISLVSIGLIYPIWRASVKKKQVHSIYLAFFCLSISICNLYFSNTFDRSCNISLMFVLATSSVGMFRWAWNKQDSKILLAGLVGILPVFSILLDLNSYDPYELGSGWISAITLSLFSLSIFIFLHNKFSDLGEKYIKGISVLNGFIAWLAVFVTLFISAAVAKSLGKTPLNAFAYIELGVIAGTIIFSMHLRGIQFAVARFVEAKAVEKTMALLDGIDAAAILCTKDGRTQDANRSALEMFEGNEIKDVPLWEAWNVPKNVVDEILNNKDPEATEWKVNWDLDDRGTKRYFEGTVRILSDGSRLVATARDQTEKKVAEDKLEKLALQDSLTEIPNRRALMLHFKQKIQESVKIGGGFSIAFADLNGFKKINDISGHAGGDTFLKKISTYFKGYTQKGIYVSRFAGDEFIFVFPIGMETNKVKEIILELITEVEKPFDLQNNMRFSLGMSVGVAQWPQDGITPDEVVQHADVALYKAKELGERFSIYNQEMANEVARKLTIESVIKESLVNDQGIYQYYQPQIDSDTNTIVGVEALFRLRNDVLGGWVNPAEVIAIAENSGLAWELGRWSLDKALITADKIYAYNKNCKVSVNVSARQFDDTVFWESLRNLAKKGGPNKIKIEITEGTIVADINHAKKILNEMVNLGYIISMDDFGVGYSSLSYLIDLPFGELKIDQSFVRNIGKGNKSEALIEASLFMAKEKNMSVVAEGVETQDQLDWIKSKGCTKIQGYFYSKPLPYEELEAKYFLN